MRTVQPSSLRRRPFNRAVAPVAATLYQDCLNWVGTGLEGRSATTDRARSLPVLRYALTKALEGMISALSRYSQAVVWMVLSVKLMSRAARSAPLSAATPVGLSPCPVAQIRLSWTW